MGRGGVVGWVVVRWGLVEVGRGGSGRVDGGGVVWVGC